MRSYHYVLVYLTAGLHFILARLKVLVPLSSGFALPMLLEHRKPLN